MKISELAEILVNRTDLKITINETDAIVMSNSVIRVMFRSDDKYVVAEHEANFDKWSKAFYRCEFPENDLEVRILTSDLVYIQSEENVASGNNFGRIVRYF